MNKFTTIFLSSAACMLSWIGTGQSQESGRGGIAAFAPGMNWEVESLPESRRALSRGGLLPQDKPAPTKETGRLLETNVILDQGFRKQVFHTDNGEKLERYVRDGQLLVLEGNGTFSFQPLDPDMPGGLLSSKNMTEFSWIAPKWKTGSATVDGAECDIYARPTDAEEGTSPERKQWIFAAIGRADHLPRRLESPETVRRYTFSTTNPVPKLPDGVVLAIHRMNEAAKEISQRYAVPQ